VERFIIDIVPFTNEMKCSRDKMRLENKGLTYCAMPYIEYDRVYPSSLTSNELECRYESLE